jgi:DNA polymerase III subunit beta
MITSRKHLLQSLETAAATAARKSTNPVLTTIRLSAAGGTLTVAATRISQSVTVTLSCSGDLDPICVVAADVLSRVRELSGEECTIVAAQDKATLKADGARKFALPTLPGSEFPKIHDAPGAGWTTVPTEALTDLVRRVERFICPDESRQTLNSLLLEPVPGGLRSVATNGHALAYCERTDVALPEQVLIPHVAVAALTGTEEEQIDLAVSDGRLFMRAGGTVYSTLTAPGPFPAYRAVVPEAERILSVDAAALLGAVKAVGVAVPDDKGLIAEFGSGSVTLSAAYGEASDEVPITWAASPCVARVGFSPRLLQHALLGLSGNATVEISVHPKDDLAPILVRAGNAVQVVMPMRV